MLVACWSSKGGAGTTVVAASLALLLARRDPASARCSSTWPATCPPRSAWPSPTARASPAGWRPAPTSPPTRSRRLEVPAGPGLALLPRGDGPARPTPAPRCSPRSWRPTPGPWSSTAAPTRPAPPWPWPRRRHPLGARHPGLLPGAAPGRSRAPLRPSEVVLVTEPGRALAPHDVEDCVGAPVVAEVAVDPAVARAVDAGLLATRLPRGPGPGAGPCRLTAPTDRRRRRSTLRLLGGDPATGRRPRPGRRRRSPAAPAPAPPTRTWRAVGRRGHRPGRRASARSSRSSADPAVTEVMVNGAGPVWVERAGRLERTDRARSTAPEVDLLVERIVGAARAAGRPLVTRGRRPPARRLPGQRRRAAARRRRPVHHHPPLRSAADPPRRALPAGRRRPARAGPWQPAATSS